MVVIPNKNKNNFDNVVLSMFGDNPRSIVRMYKHNENIFKKTIEKYCPF